jgi:hypothetical protein
MFHLLRIKGERISQILYKIKNECPLLLLTLIAMIFSLWKNGKDLKVQIFLTPMKMKQTFNPLIQHLWIYVVWFRILPQIKNS